MLKKLSEKISQVLGTSTGRSGRNQRRPSRFRPEIESLEDRAVPATIAVTTFADVVNPNDNVVSLREAINRANATPGADTILLRAGTYKIGLVGTDNTNAAGDFDVTSSVNIVGRGARKTIIEGNTADTTRDRLFEALGSINMGFAKLTLRNGGNGQFAGGAVNAQTANLRFNQVALTNNFSNKGGAINAENGNVTLFRSSMTNNAADGSGGAISAGKGNVILNRSTVQSNQGANGGGVFTLDGNVTAINSTLTNNHAFNSRGGALFSLNGDIEVANSRFIANDAPLGGAIDAQNGDVNVFRSLMERNRASENGGAIRAPAGTVTLRDSTLRSNVAGQPVIATTGLGGAVFASVANVIRSNVTGNTAYGTGGGIHALSTANLIASTVSDNQARFGGGGVFAVTASATNSTISGNTTSDGFGGGINATTVDLTNSTISGNKATSSTGRGGGIFASRGTFLHSTIAENFAVTTGGGVAWAGGADKIQVKNTIIANNMVLTLPEVGQDVSGDFISNGNNLIGVVNGSTGFGVPGDLVGTTSNPLNPRLSPLGFHGGRTKTHALLAGSPAIDHGDNTSATTTDQRGVARPRDGDGNGSRIVDIGAYER